MWCIFATFLYYAWWKGERLPSSLVELNTEVFFDALLPPIIFQAGFAVKKKAFFRNFMTLLLLGVVGTWMTAAMVATGTSYMLKWLGLRSDLVRSSLSLGAIFSASDSVAALQVLDQDRSPMLFSLVFGEGVVNDAVSIVLLRAVQGIRKSSQLNADTLSLIALSFGQLFVLSLLLGAAVGLFSAWFIKRTFVHHSTDREVAAVALLGFVAYQLAEGLHLSGIFSVFFCGIVMSHYTWHAMSSSARVVTVYLFRILSFAAELFLFIYAGVTMWSVTLWKDSEEFTKGKLVQASTILALALVASVLVARALTVAPLVLLANLWRPRACRISVREGAVIWWAGAMRGAITVALAFKTYTVHGIDAPLENQIFIVSSMTSVILFTVVLGAFTSGLVGRLLGQDELAPGATMPTLPSMDPDSLNTPLLAALQRSLHWTRHSHIYRLWHYIDDNYLYPLFGGRAPKPDCYRSPPPSPGRQMIQEVMGPVMFADSSRPAKHADPFRMRPAPSDGTEAGVSLASAGRAGSRGTGQAPTVRSVHPEAVDMQPSDGIEELLEHANSGRLDSEHSQQIDWRDSAAFGKDAAWLAEGAPSGSWDSAGRSRLLSGSLQAEHGTQQAAQQVQQQAAGQQAAVTLARTSPFQGVASHPVGSPTTSP
ncbi:hypothetical protein COHA_004923 [Chlorella ohadii]|uniref:Cation/H+ exchanger transmembrane domain-containing protein n=1 Tax=Chlorella ohadii TaxID=2649997 RepID=A0AAD5DVW1_9CHLO|nr:hypothetical protein COHA_004923 [Chlorella ohadii]